MKKNTTRCVKVKLRLSDETIRFLRLLQRFHKESRKNPITIK
jgi:hypothetical protein